MGKQLPLSLFVTNLQRQSQMIVDWNHEPPEAFFLSPSDHIPRVFRHTEQDTD